MFNNSVKKKIKEEMQRQKIALNLLGLSGQKAVKTAKLAQKYGVNVFEVSIKAEYSGLTIAGLCDELGDEAIVGAGDIFCTEYSDGDVEYARQYGAKFVDSPINNNVLVDSARNFDCVCIAGAQTLTEIFFAHSQGGGFVRLAPAADITAARIAQICEEIDYIKLCICGDVGAELLKEYFDAGLSLYVLKDKSIESMAQRDEWDLLERYMEDKFKRLCV